MHQIYLNLFQFPKLPYNSTIQDNPIIGLVGSINIEIAGKNQCETKKINLG